MIEDLQRFIYLEKDRAIRQAVTDWLGRSDWTNEEVLPRMQRICWPTGAESITLDGKVIISFLPTPL